RSALSVHRVVTCASAAASYGKRCQFTPSALASTIPGSAKTLQGSAAVAGGAEQKNAFSKTMKSGPGPSMMALSENSSTIDPPCPSDTTVRVPLVGVVVPGGPRTIPGCHELKAGGDATVPRLSATTRSGKQSVAAPAIVRCGSASATAA